MSDQQKEKWVALELFGKYIGNKMVNFIIVHFSTIVFRNTKTLIK